MIPWILVGKNYDGETQALIFEIKKEDLDNDIAIKAIDKKRPLQNSVKMRYYKIFLAVNSNEPEYKENHIGTKG